MAMTAVEPWQREAASIAAASGRQKKWCKLIVAKQEMGIGESQEHRATADCLDTLAVLRKIAKEPEDLFSMSDTDEGGVV